MYYSNFYSLTPEMDIPQKSPKAGLGAGHFALPKSRRTPSFSSSLLDSIYRSIDESRDPPVSEQRRWPRSSDHGFDSLREEMANFRKALAAEKMAQSLSNSGSTSSESSSSGGGSFFSSSSSSETESNLGAKAKPKLQAFRPIRTRAGASSVPSARMERAAETAPAASEQKPKIPEGRFTRTKSRALKMYGELKRGKHPISPGGKIASFINSLFSNSGNSKKSPAKPGSIDPPAAAAEVIFHRKSKSGQEFSSPSPRSCLSSATAPTTPTSFSSRGSQKSGGCDGGPGGRRCVRFCPVSVIVDEDSQPCGEKNLFGYDDYHNFARIAEAKLRDSKNRGGTERCRAGDRVGSAARNCQLRDREYQYNQKKGTIFGELGLGDRFAYREIEEQDEDDAESCASSDLFELENMVGNGRYGEELPVYETTNVRTNQAIASGFIF